MIAKDLYNEILIKPIEQGANALYVVSGYASPNMASKHIKDINDLIKKSKSKANLNINLNVGMCHLDGIDILSHEGFISLMDNVGKVKFECKYVYSNSAVNSKLYVWFKNSVPFIAFTGSANYSQPAFGNNRREVLTDCNAEEAYKYYEQIEADTIYCNHPDIAEYVDFTKRKVDAKTKRAKENIEAPQIESQLISDSKVTLSFLQRNGEVGAKSGLNWGQRNKREPNQAYIPLPRKIAKSGFFPLNKTHFTVTTDDNISLILRVEQQGDKAITTPQSNSRIGEYFRSRLNLANGQFVKREHLEKHGRTDVDFYKIDDETFYMDFSANK